MTTTLITGATKGLGYESARRLVDAGHTVYLAARDPERGRQAADALGARLTVLDVTDDRSAAAAADQLKGEVGYLDVLVNNAGVGGAARAAGDMSAADVRNVYDTNVFGVIRVTQAFLPLLKAAPAPLVVNVSSGLGSLTLAADLAQHQMDGPYLAYGSSKAALNMLTVQYARALPAIRFLAVNPGFTATGLNGFTGTQTIEQGTDAIVQAALQGGGAATAAFVSREGTVPW